MTEKTDHSLLNRVHKDGEWHASQGKNKRRYRFNVEKGLFEIDNCPDCSKVFEASSLKKRLCAECTKTRKKNSRTKVADKPAADKPQDPPANGDKDTKAVDEALQKSQEENERRLRILRMFPGSKVETIPEAKPQVRLSVLAHGFFDIRNPDDAVRIAAHIAALAYCPDEGTIVSIEYKVTCRKELTK